MSSDTRIECSADFSSIRNNINWLFVLCIFIAQDLIYIEIDDKGVVNDPDMDPRGQSTTFCNNGNDISTLKNDA